MHAGPVLPAVSGRGTDLAWVGTLHYTVTLHCKVTVRNLTVTVTPHCKVAVRTVSNFFFKIFERSFLQRNIHYLTLSTLWLSYIAISGL